LSKSLYKYTQIISGTKFFEYLYSMKRVIRYLEKVFISSYRDALPEPNIINPISKRGKTAIWIKYKEWKKGVRGNPTKKK